jgi:hypothetical protein
VIEDATVDLSTPSHALQQATNTARFYAGPDPHWRAQTDSLGVARFDALPARVPLTIETRARDHAMRQESDPATLVPGEQGSIEVLFGSGGVVRGRVTDREGHAIASCPLWRVASEDPTPRWFQGFEHPAARATADVDGRFVFSDVPPGIWNIGPGPAFAGPGGKPFVDFAGLAPAVEMHDGGEQIDLALVVDRRLALRGTVVDPSGAPVAQCHVFAHMSGARATANVDTDESGAFELANLPAGEWLASANMRHGEFAPSDEVRAAAGASGVVLRLRAGGSLRGRAIDARTRAPTPCEVTLAALDESLGATVSGSRDGTFALECLLPGSYVLSAKTTDLRFAHRRVEVRAGVSIDTFELVLAPAAQVALHFSGAGSSANYSVSIKGDRIASGTLPPGASETCVVPAGTLEVRWSIAKTELEHSQSFSITPGETRELAWDGKP